MMEAHLLQTLGRRKIEPGVSERKETNYVNPVIAGLWLEAQ